MSTLEAQATAPPPIQPIPPPVSKGWLGPQSIFEQKDERKLGSAMGVSATIHAIFLALLVVVGIRSAQTVLEAPKEDLNFVFLNQPGPGGGGGGSPAPAPVKKLEIPKAKPPEPVPVTPVPPVPVPPPPAPTFSAPVMTNSAQVLQAPGASNISLADLGGGGRGGGIGRGTGNGLGEGTGGGTGGGVYQIGNGVESPTIVHKERPNYTSEAMRAKIQGDVELEAVVMPNGTVSDIHVTKSLDRTFGLDLEAIKAAQKWLFRPGTKEGKPVAVRVVLVLEFRLH